MLLQIISIQVNIKAWSNNTNHIKCYRIDDNNISPHFWRNLIQLTFLGEVNSVKNFNHKSQESKTIMSKVVIEAELYNVNNMYARLIY